MTSFSRNEHCSSSIHSLANTNVMKLRINKLDEISVDKHWVCNGHADDTHTNHCYLPDRNPSFWFARVTDSESQKELSPSCWLFRQSFLRFTFYIRHFCMNWDFQWHHPVHEAAFVQHSILRKGLPEENDFQAIRDRDSSSFEFSFDHLGFDLVSLWTTLQPMYYKRTLITSENKATQNNERVSEKRRMY